MLPRARRGACPATRFRFDPNGVWSTEQAIWFGQRIEDLNNDYLEDPVFGLHGMRRTREKVRMPLATNTVVVGFEQLAANVLDTAVDVILLDTTFWGGIRQCVKAAGVCETFQLGVAVHSSGELGIQLATMLHLGAVIPNLSFAADAHYHHLVDDVIVGGKMKYCNGAHRGADGARARREARPRQAGGVPRAVQAARDVSVRPGPAAARLDADDPEQSLGRPEATRASRTSRADARTTLRCIARSRISSCALTARRVLLRRSCVARAGARDEDGYDLWLRYRQVADAARLAEYRGADRGDSSMQGDSPTLRVARDELSAGLARPAWPPRRVRATVVGRRAARRHASGARRRSPRSVCALTLQRRRPKAS